ncbi:MAG: hypothetical protein MHPSP_003077, partial [Paramarteilia canceri]
MGSSHRTRDQEGEADPLEKVQLIAQQLSKKIKSSSTASEKSPYANYESLNDSNSYNK